MAAVTSMTVELSNGELSIICSLLRAKADDWDKAAKKKGSNEDLPLCAGYLRKLDSKLSSPLT